jgi:hypothetical protein
MHRLAVGLLLSGLFLMPGGAAAAEKTGQAAPEPSGHLRSGLWRQWILWIEPGPQAAEALARSLARVSSARVEAALAPLKLSAEPLLVFAVYDEDDARGPDGESVPGGNREMFFATFVEVEGGGPLVLFLADPLRSSAELTARGVPGAPGAFQHAYEVDGQGAERRVRTRSSCEAGPDSVHFTAVYAAEAIEQQRSFPPAAEYLGASLAHSLDVLFASRPTEPFRLWERSSSSWIPLPRAGVTVTLTVKLQDPDLSAMFTDPGNRPVRLVELHRQVRFQR